MTYNLPLMYDLQHHPSEPVRDDSGEILSAQDWLGNRFHVGEQVLYCVATGSTGCAMAIGIVVRIVSDTKTRYDYRPARDDETPDFVNRYSNPPTNWMTIEVAYDDMRVMVRTLRTSASFDNGKRTRNSWVTAMNITALPLEGLR